MKGRISALPLSVLALAFALVPAPAAGQVPGVANFHKVDEQLYRGAQPTTQGFQSLAKMGIKTVVDLREADGRSKAERAAVTAAGMKYINIPLNGLAAPSDAEVKRVLEIFRDHGAGPVFVHCRRGADRTGTVCACYRISHDGWENAKALAEAKSFGMSWVETAMQRYVLRFRPEHAGAVPANVQ
jgi:tyrosine-protein phosphatase SIW14